MVSRFRQWLRRLSASPAGSEAIAQGPEAMAAGTRGVSVQGNVQTSVIITGDGNTIHHSPALHDPAAALATYCRTLAISCRHLPLRGVDIHASDPTADQRRLDLAQVYVALRTTARLPRTDADPLQHSQRQPRATEFTAEEDSASLSALEAVVSHQRLVLLGDPGSGKSTFLTHLALCLAAHIVDSQAGWLARLPGWSPHEAHSVPILVVLRDFARWLSTTGVTQAAPRHLWDFIVTGLAAQKLEHVAEPLHEALEQGRAALLLDGLDEIPTTAQRALVRDAVAAYATRYARSRLVVTCRTLSYQDPAGQLPDTPAVTLASFDEAQIDGFIGA
jgi:predicted NACHT family NTPase